MRGGASAAPEGKVLDGRRSERETAQIKAFVFRTRNLPSICRLTPTHQNKQNIVTVTNGGARTEARYKTCKTKWLKMTEKEKEREAIDANIRNVRLPGRFPDVDVLQNRSERYEQE